MKIKLLPVLCVSTAVALLLTAGAPNTSASELAAHCASAPVVLLLTTGEPPNTPASKPEPPNSARRLPAAATERILSEQTLSNHARGGRPQQFPSLGVMHEEYLRRFQAAPDFGLSRIPYLPRKQELALPEMTYTIKLPDLISLENAPFVYRSSGFEMVSMAALTNRATRPRLPKRALTAEETKAVKELRAGRDFATIPIKVQAARPTSPSSDQLSMQEVPGLLAVGALRAKAACAKCHGCAEGTLLGAFSYQLVPVRDVPAPTPAPTPTPAPSLTILR